MKCKIIFDTKTKPTYENFEKAELFEECKPIWDILKFACRNRNGKFIEGYLYCLELESVYTFYYARSLDSISYIPTYQLLNKLVKPSPLTFNTLRKANIARIPEFKNSKGEPAHSKSDGSDWSPAQWLQAIIGELGEYANVMKKVERGDLTFEEAKPLIEKELADVQTYLDLLAFRVDVDLSKAVEQKFNEVSERVGCSLRIENNEVVRKSDMNKTYEFVLSTYSQAVNYAKLGSGELTTFSINNRKSFVSTNSEESKLIEFEIEKEFKCSGKCGVESWQVPTVGTITNIKVQTTNSIINENVTLSVSENDEIKVSVNPKMTDEETQENSNRMEKYKSSAKQIASNWIGTSKISNTTRAKIEDLIEKDILDIKKSIDSESGKVSDIELIVNAALMGVRFGDAAKLKVDLLIKNDLEEEEFNYETEIHKLVDKYEGCEFYPLEVSHDLITDLFGLQFQEIDTLKQYVFAQAKTFNLPKTKFGYVKIKSVNQFYLFDYFSKQLGTKIVGMLINGHKENKILNPNDTVQFYDERNVLYNFRLVKTSDKNVEVSLS